MATWYYRLAYFLLSTNECPRALSSSGCLLPCTDTWLWQLQIPLLTQHSPGQPHNSHTVEISDEGGPVCTAREDLAGLSVRRPTKLTTAVACVNPRVPMAMGSGDRIPRSLLQLAKGSRKQYKRAPVSHRMEGRVTSEILLWSPLVSWPVCTYTPHVCVHINTLITMASKPQVSFFCFNP